MKNEENLIVVGIGASAGGLHAIQQLFDAIPDDTNMAFVIVQHLAPNFVSLMPELLAKHTGMKIFTAEDKQKINANCIYLNKGSKNLHIKQNKLYLLDPGPRSNLNLPIDILFNTLGEEYKIRAVGIILSGTGSDGSRGLKRIKEEGGVILVQNPESAEFDGMPISAINTKLVDNVLPLEELGSFLVNFSKSPHFTKSLAVEDDLSNESTFTKILDIIESNLNINFAFYKPNTLLRRLEKRLIIKGFSSINNYLAYFESNPQEQEFLKQDFLIGVTSFFRDKEAFEVLKQKVIIPLCDSKLDGESVRIWVTGCSTGAEVYSIAMLFHEYIESNHLNITYKIFATDVEQEAISIASMGVYSITEGSDIPNHYLLKYFVNNGADIKIIKKIRDNIIFSVHDLLSDPPFIRQDLISCRNLLIYIKSDIQEQILSNMYIGLHDRGFLFLGSSESLGKMLPNFKSIDLKHKIFQSIGKKVMPSLNLTGAFTKTQNTLRDLKLKSALRNQQEFLKINRKSSYEKEQTYISGESFFHKYLSKKYSPEVIFINDSYQILYISEYAGKWLQHKGGIFQGNLLEMLPDKIALILKKGIKDAARKNTEIFLKKVSFRDGIEFIDLSISVIDKEKIDTSSKSDIISIVFNENKSSDKETIVVHDFELDTFAKEQIEELELALKNKEFDLQSTVEEVETSNEELQAANEELMSANEELQSTNEELQSVNEELYTVNNELKESNTKLQQLNSDYDNLINSTDIGTLFLDRKLRIRKFSPSIRKHFNIKQEDVGRKIGTFSSDLGPTFSKNIVQKSEEVFTTQETVDFEIQDSSKKFYLIKISPFIADDKSVEGIVASFIDLSKTKQIEKEKQFTEHKYQKLFENIPSIFLHARIVLNEKEAIEECFLIDANKAFKKTKNLSKKELNNYPLSQLFSNNKEKEKWFTIFGKSVLHKKEVHLESYFAPFAKHFSIKVYSPNKNEFAAIFTDINETFTLKDTLAEKNAVLNLAVDLSELAVWEWDVENDIAVGNANWEKMYGQKDKKAMDTWVKQLHPDDLEESIRIVNEHLAGKSESYSHEFRLLKHDETRWIKNTGKLIPSTAENDKKKVMGVSMDITEYKALIEKLSQQKGLSDKLLNLSPNGIYIYNTITGNNDYINTSYTKILGYTFEEVNAIPSEEFTSLFHPEDVDKVLQHMEAVMAGERFVPIEYRFQHKNGHWVWCYSVDSPFETDSDGKVTKFIGCFFDITSWKEG